MAAISLPGNSLLVLSGAPGCGKSSFASRYCGATPIVSSDQCRVMVGDHENNLAVSREAFKLFYYMIERRLSLGRLTVADSTAVTRTARRKLLRIGKKHGFNVALLAFDIPLSECLKRNAGRQRQVIRRVVARMHQDLEKSLISLSGEGFDSVHVIREDDLNNPHFNVEIRQHELTLGGPFDIVGDVHGCHTELVELLVRLGYRKYCGYYCHPEGRKAVFLGDLTDRGPDSLSVIWLVKSMVDTGNALYVPGNHCRKLARYLSGGNIEISHGMEKTVGQINALPDDEKGFLADAFLRMYRTAPPYLVLDGGRLVVAHAGIKEDMIGGINGRVRNFCLFGDVDGTVTQEGLPLRRDWARSYSGEALIVYGHTPVIVSEFVNNTVNIDQGCVKGGNLTALRYPERELLQVSSKAVYYA